MTRFALISAGFILLTLAAGCAVQPPPTPVSAVVDTAPERWQASTTTAVDAAPVPETAWWLAFGDPQLSALIDEALTNNHDLAVAAHNVDRALIQARIAGADRWPSLAARLDGSRRQQVFVGLPIPGTDGVLASRSTSLGASLDISWEADLWGRLRAGRRAVEGDAQGIVETYRGTRLSISAQTAKAWVALVAAEGQVRLAEATLASRTQSVAQIERRYRRGVTPPVDLRLARAEHERARATVADEQRRRDAASRQLESLVGRYPAAVLVGDRAALPAPPPTIAAGLPATLVTRRPDIRAVERQLASAGWRVAEARAALYPRLTLTASGGSTSDDLRDLLNDDFSVWSVAGGLLKPLFQGGRLRAAVELAETDRSRILAVYAGTVLRAFTEVELALAADGALAAQARALTAAATESRAALRLAERRYAAGTTQGGQPQGYLTVLDSQRQVFQAERQLLALRQQRWINRIDLHLALGGATVTSAARATDDIPPPPVASASPSTIQPHQPGTP